MSVERAQKSEVHEATDDAASSPANRTNPDQTDVARAEAAKDDLRIKNDPDEASFGGPVKIDDPTSSTN
jgi:hypothetical protein